MARTGENEAKAAQAQTTAQQGQAYNRAQTEVGQFGKNVGTLERGGEVGADPFLSAGYLANQNRLTSYATEGENDSAKTALEDQNRRTGGQNTGATQATIADLARGKMRMGNQLQTQRSAEDYKSNLGYQQYLAGLPLQQAGVEGGLYGTATGGRDASLGDLTQLGLASYGPWQAAIGAAGQAAGAALTKGKS